MEEMKQRIMLLLVVAAIVAVATGLSATTAFAQTAPQQGPVSDVLSGVPVLGPTLSGVTGSVLGL
jgi:hypothetical protein